MPAPGEQQQNRVNGAAAAGSDPLHPSSARASSPLPTVRLLKIAMVLERYPVSESQLYSMIQHGKFPKPVHPGGGHGSFWIEAEVDAWIGAQIEVERRAA